MYSLFMEKDLLEKAKQAAQSFNIPTSVYVREAIIERVPSRGKIAQLEKRIEILERNIL